MVEEKTHSAYQAVVHLSTGGAEMHRVWARQMRNFWQALPATLIEVVVHAGAVDFLRISSTVAPYLTELEAQGVQFLVCANTLKDRSIAPEELLPFIQVVPSALAHIVIRQSAGWAYVKL